jgi:hypothetical protein
MSKDKGCPSPVYDNRIPTVFPAVAPKYASILPRGMSSSPPVSRSRTHLRFCVRPSETGGAEPVEKMDRASKNVRKGNSIIVVSSVCDGSGGVGEADSGLIGL